MSSEEKLEQSTIVKERGTMYFKVSLPRGPEHAPEERTSPSGPELPGQAGVGVGRGGTFACLWATGVHRVRQLGATEAVPGA